MRFKSDQLNHVIDRGWISGQKVKTGGHNDKDDQELSYVYQQIAFWILDSTAYKNYSLWRHNYYITSFYWFFEILFYLHTFTPHNTAKYTSTPNLHQHQTAPSAPPTPKYKKYSILSKIRLRQNFTYSIHLNAPQAPPLYNNTTKILELILWWSINTNSTTTLSKYIHYV